MGTAILLAAATAIAGCGGDSESSDPGLQIPAAVAGRLAELSDRTADQLDAGEDCHAEATVEQLRQEAEDAQLEVPDALRPEVQAGIEKLASGIDCAPAPPPEPAQKPEKQHKPKGEEKKKEDHCPPGLEKKEEHGSHDDNGPGNDEHGNFKCVLPGKPGEEGG
jgi:hypothetical protein